MVNNGFSIQPQVTSCKRDRVVYYKNIIMKNSGALNMNESNQTVIPIRTFVTVTEADD